MKINKKELLENPNILNHLVIHGLTKALPKDKEFSEWVDQNWNKKESIEIKLTIGNKEIDIKYFCDHWESQVDDMIIEKAKEIIGDQFVNIRDLLFVLEEKIKGEIK